MSGAPDIMLLDPAITTNWFLEGLTEAGYVAIVEQDIIIAWRNTKCQDKYQA